MAPINSQLTPINFVGETVATYHGSYALIGVSQTLNEIGLVTGAGSLIAAAFPPISISAGIISTLASVTGTYIDNSNKIGSFNYKWDFVSSTEVEDGVMWGVRTKTYADIHQVKLTHYWDDDDDGYVPDGKIVETSIPYSINFKISYSVEVIERDQN